MNLSKHLYLIDGSGYIFRAYYAVRPLSTSKGLPTNALYGFTQMLIKLMKEVNPEYWAIVFDTKEPTFRDAMYADYKANRSEPPDDLVPQFEYFPKIARALNIPMYVKPGFEADDLIATFAAHARKKDFQVTLISGDKDLMQLVGEKVSMWDTLKEKHYDSNGVFAKFGVAPEKITDLFGLMGDSSDNIPGVPGVGLKTASQLIAEFGSLERLLENSGSLKGRLKENIENNKETAILSKKLSTLCSSVPIDFEEEKLRHRPFDQEACHKLFRELEFASLLSELTPKRTLSKENYRLILDSGELKGLVRSISREKAPLALDLETTSLDVMKAEIVGFALSWKEGEAAYIPVGHTGLDTPRQMTLKEVAPILQPLLEDPEIQKVGQNLKYDLAILRRHNIEVKGIAFDTMIASYLLNPKGPHNLDDLSQQHLDHRTIRYEEVTGKGAKQKSFAEVGLKEALAYAAEDADCTLRLFKIFKKQIEENQLTPLFYELEMPLMEILLKMEMTGVLVDEKILKKLSRELALELEKLEKIIFESAGGPFKINSPKQLGEVLFEKLKLAGAKRTKTGYATHQTLLESYARIHPLPGLVLEYRSLSKLKSTYSDALAGLINKETGRIHTSFNQTIAATGRLSSSEPNLQNIPIRSREGKKIREAFIAGPGFLLLSADYSQIELRILAHFTEDEGLIKAYQKNEDVHQMTANALGCSRDVGKTVNFATIYGQTPYGLSQQLKIDVAQAARYIENYFGKYPKVKPFREKILEEAQKKGLVETLAGRRRFVPELLSQNISIRNNAERMAFNTVFQGSAADIIKKAMIAIDRELSDVSDKARLLVQVHDELLFEVPEREVDKVKRFVSEKMEGAYQLKIPLVVGCGVGKNWAEAH